MTLRQKTVLLGLVLLSGLVIGCASDSDKLRDKAEKGDIQAQATLASDYLKGDGVKRSRQKARFWAEKAARKGHPKALVVMGLTFIQTKKENQDFNKARQFFETAAQTQYPSAQFNLGVMYERGDGVPKDIAMAKSLYEKAAKQGEARAQNNLGRLMTLDKKPDYVTAYMWLKLAVDAKKANPTLLTQLVQGKKLSLVQLKEAEMRATEWKPVKVYKQDVLVPKAHVDKVFKALGSSSAEPSSKSSKTVSL